MNIYGKKKTENGRDLSQTDGNNISKGHKEETSAGS